MPTNDIPATDAELDSFYGVPATQAEIEEAIKRQSAAFDKDDLLDILYEHGDKILADLANAYTWSVGDRIYQVRKETIARRTSMELYGKPGIIKPSQVE